MTATKIIHNQLKKKLRDANPLIRSTWNSWNRKNLRNHHLQFKKSTKNWAPRSLKIQFISLVMRTLFNSRILLTPPPIPSSCRSSTASFNMPSGKSWKPTMRSLRSTNCWTKRPRRSGHLSSKMRDYSQRSRRYSIPIWFWGQSVPNMNNSLNYPSYSKSQYR